jgi:hypothetical protein
MKYGFGIETEFVQLTNLMVSYVFRLRTKPGYFVE